MAQEERIFGLHAVRTVLERRPGDVQGLLLQTGRGDKRIAEVEQLAKERGIRVEHRSAQELDGLASGGVHQGVIARVTPAAPLNENGLLDLVQQAKEPVLLLILDGVQDPHNLGACLRTADAAGVNAVVVPRDRASGLTPVVRKVAAGAAETVAFVQVTNLARTLRELKDCGVWIVGTAGDAPAGLYDVDLKGPLAVVMGAEGTGLRRLTREHCDHLVKLPMRGAVESLNVSVATGVVLYEALRQRGLR